MLHTRILPGLPPYGPMPIAFPPEWGKLGREGTVVEFKDEGETWVGSFQPGLGGLQFAGLHPNGLDGAVIAAGDLWIVNAGERNRSSEAWPKGLGLAHSPALLGWIRPTSDC